MGTGVSTRPTARDFLRLMRPSQWPKNLIVLAAFFFAYWDRERAVPLSPADLRFVIPAFILFCLVSSGIYALNDVRDAAADRHHPVKSRRPVAAGRISEHAAALFSLALLAVGLFGSALLSWPFAGIVSAYVALQLVYTFALKRIPLVDILLIACGFVLRAIAGGVVLGTVTISPWLLLCTFLLALFLALCKRRHEKRATTDSGHEHRPSLEKYDPHLLDQLIAIVSGATIVCYAIYTLWPETVDKFGTSKLGLTIPFVVFGIFRYLDLVYRHEKGGRPEKILLTDMPLLADIGLYVLTLVVIFQLSAAP